MWIAEDILGGFGGFAGRCGSENVCLEVLGGEGSGWMAYKGAERCMLRKTVGHVVFPDVVWIRVVRAGFARCEARFEVDKGIIQSAKQQCYGTNLCVVE